ncbi:MAG: ABC transporter permease [Sulfolobales archaeon]
MIEDLLVILSMTTTSMTPILLASVGEILTERSGVVNIGIEGIFILSSFIATLATFYIGDPYIGLLLGVLIGFLSGLTHGVLAVYLRADQIIMGVGYNLLAYGLAVVGLVAVWSSHGASPTLPEKTGFISFYVGKQLIIIQPLAIVAVGLAILMWYVLEKTSLGLRIKACGEDPRSAEANGVNVYMIRILATSIGGALAGLGGAYLTVSWIGQFTRSISAGRGFIALANVAFSNWNPLTAILGALIFGFFDVLSLYIPIKLSLLYGVVLSSQNYLFLTIPYVATLIVVAFISKRIRMPRSLGQVYIKE